MSNPTGDALHAAGLMDDHGALRLMEAGEKEICQTSKGLRDLAAKLRREKRPVDLKRAS